ncbi:MAG TPA: carboxypeptidase-like regulatory domain-containing protein, partial [Planctomycetota bacterium]|nr:carboxypeptidase-like regulatory domain-containing protein [Planctomycetota bacterium]
MQVRIVDPQGAPVPGAKIVLTRAPRAMTGPRRKEERVADAAGRTFVAAGDADVEVVAKTSGAAGRLLLETADLRIGGERRLQLNPDRIIEVTALDADGGPVPGLALRLEARAEGGGQRLGRALPYTDAAGRARVEVQGDEVGVYDGTSHQVHGTFPGQKWTKAPVTWSGDRGEATLRAEGAGLVAMDVIVELPEGVSTPPADLDVSWRFETSTVEERRSATTAGLRPVDGLSATFGGFPRGREILFAARSGAFMEGRTVATTPTSGARGEVRVTLGPPKAWVRWPMRGAGDAPLRGWVGYVVEQTGAAAPMSADPSYVDGALRRQDAELDEDGVLRVGVTPGLAGELKIAGGRPNLAGPPTRDGPGSLVVASRSFPALAPGEVHDLPPEVWPTPALLVGGRVVDAAGAPVAGAAVRVGKPDGGAADLFRRLAAAATTSGADGRFEVRGDASAAALEGARVQATTGEASSAAPTFAVGATDVDLVVRAFGGLKGAIVRTDAARTGKISITARRRESASSPGAASVARAEPDPESGAFELAGLDHGPCDVRVLYEREVALIVEKVEVVPGVSAADPRLARLVVGDRFLDAVVTTTASDGSPIEGAMVSFEVRDGGESAPTGRSLVATDARGTARRLFAAAPDRIRVRVSAKGYASTTIDDARFPLAVTLGRGAAIRVRFEAPLRLPTGDGLSWSIAAATG